MAFDQRCIYYVTYLLSEDFYVVEVCEGAPLKVYFAGPFNEQQAHRVCAQLNAGNNPQLTTFM